MAEGNRGFHWQQVPWGEVLVCDPLLEVARHLFTARLGDLTPDADRHGSAALTAALGLRAGEVRTARQVHGVDVVVADRAERPPEATADILLARGPQLAVAVRVADCVPILVADRGTGAVGAIHAGWRGTYQGAAIAAVDALSRTFGTDPGNLVAAIGPSIGRCCYQVGSDVREAFGAAAGRLPSQDGWFTPDGPHHWRLDLWKANQDQLVAAGLASDAIFMAKECTSCQVDRFASFRREGAAAGRQLAAIRPASG